MNKQEFNKVFDKVLQESGFKKQKSSYYRDYPAVLMVFFPQKSVYSETYYIQYGYCIKAINGHLPYPPAHESDLELRMGICLENSNNDLDYQIEYPEVDMEQFESAFRKRVRDVIIPDGCDDIEFVAQLIRKMHRSEIPGKTKKFFGL